MIILLLGISIGVFAYAVVHHLPTAKDLGSRYVQWWPFPHGCPICVAFWLGAIVMVVLVVCQSPIPYLGALPAISAATAHMLHK